MAKKTRLAIPMVGNHQWHGGVIYVQLAAAAIRSLPQQEQPELLFLLRNGQEGSLDLYRPFLPLFDKVVLVGFPAQAHPDVAGVPITCVPDIHAAHDHFDVLYPMRPLVMPGVKGAAWIPDFQHRHLPQFFSPQDLKERDEAFAKVAEKSRLCVFSSKDAERDFRTFYPGSKCQTHILHFFHRLPDAAYGQPVDAVLAKHGVARKFLLCCNQFWIHKGHDILFRAFARIAAEFPDVELVCTGGTEDYRARDHFTNLTRFLADAGMTSRVKILGLIPRDDQLQLLRASMGVIHPSLFEGWSTVVEDCRSLGKRMILSDLGVHLEQDPPGAVFFRQGDGDDLLEKLRATVPGWTPGPDLTVEEAARRESEQNLCSFGRELMALCDKVESCFASEESAMRSLERASQHLASGKIDDLLAELDQQEVQESTDPRVHRAAGNLLLRAGLLNQGRAQFQLATRVDPSDAQAYLDLGITWMLLGRMEESGLTLAKSLELAPERGDVWKALGHLHLRTGNREACVEAFRKALDRMPDDIECRVLVGGWHARRNEVNPLVTATAKEFLELLSQGGSVSTAPEPQNTPEPVDRDGLNATLAKLDEALSKGDLASAAELSDEVVALRPGDVEHLRASGHIHLKLGDREMARNRFHRATIADPGSAAAHADLGVVWFLLERWNDATLHLETALRLDPSRTDIPPVLGMINDRKQGASRPPCDLESTTLTVPPHGSTERFIRMIPLRRSRSVEAGPTWVRNLSIRDFGSGEAAFDGIIRHVLKNKIGLAEPTRAVNAHGCVAFSIEMGLSRARDGRPADAPFQDLAAFDPEFATAEGPVRARDILEYRDRILGGEDPGESTFVTGALLNSLGARVAPDELWMIDGARRISAQALAGRRIARAIVLTTEDHHAELLPQGEVESLRRRVAEIKWFANYQSIPLVGLKGDRSTRRFELFDPSMLEGCTVADWGCNIGQASVRAALAGASKVVGIEGMPDTFHAATEVGRLSGLSNLRFERIDFNAPDFNQLVDEALPDKVDWSFFFSVYRTKELVQRDRLFQKIIDKSRKGILFEGHADKVIDTLDYYRWLFEAYGLQWRHLGNSEGDIRPLFLLTWDPSTQRRQNPSWPSTTRTAQTMTPAPAVQKPERQLASRTSDSTPLVSAIVSTYASSTFLRHRLENLLSQSLGDRLEVVVVDSGSPENDGEIAEEFARRDPRVKVVRTKERETIYQAWNRGLEASRGRFLTNANTDDVLRRDALEHLASELDSSTAVDLVYGDFWITHLPNQDFEGAVRIGYSLKPEFAPSIMLTGCHMGPQPMWRRSLHDRFGMFDPAFHAAGDYEFWCRCVAGGAVFRHVPEFLGLYLHNLDGLCNGNVPRVVRETASVKEIYKRKLPAPPDGFCTEGFYRKDPLPDGAGYVNIGMVTWNRLEFSKESMEALWKRTRYPYKLTVVDNGSTDGTVAWLREMHRQGKISNLVLLPENVGVAKASNIAWAAEPDATYYMKLDSDMVPLKDDWLENLVDAATRLPGIGALGYSVEPRSYPLETISGIRVRPKRDANIGGACFLVPKAVHERLGWWCEDYGLYGEEDGDFSLRIRLAGLFNAYMEDEDAFCHLPGGKAGAIDPRDLSAVDPAELRIHEDYRIWKDDLRRELQKPGGLLHRNVAAYHSGQRSIFVPRGQFQGLLGNDLQAFVRDGAFEFHPIDGKVAAPHEDRVADFARSHSLPDPIADHDMVAAHGFLTLRKEPIAKAKASVVIPVHGHLDLTRQCVAKVLETTDRESTEIIVVDDASPDDSARWLREQEAAGVLKAVLLSLNRGFAGACNAGAEAASGEYLVFLNNDTIPRDGWLDSLLAPLVQPGIGLTGARLLYPEGDIQHAGIRLHPNGVPDHEFRHAAAEAPEVATSRDRAFVTGACIGLRKDLFDRIGGFDTGFRMYVEDLDLCLKVWNEGLRVRYVAECVVVHLESRTTPDLEKRTVLVKTGMERLFSRWMGRWPEGLFALPDWPANFRNTLANPAKASEAPPLHAFAPALNFTGYARLNREAFLALEAAGAIHLSLDPSVNNAEFIRGVEAQGEAATAPWNRIFARKPDHSGFCLISDLPCNFAKLRASRPAFARYAGLTMFETDRLPAGWRDDCLGVDEIWVPSSFNLRSFAAAGVPERMIKRIPCGIDMDRFRPGAATPLRVDGRRGTNFLSVFEWTPRKGWDVLLLGWAKAFSRDDDASLTLKAYLADSKPGELAARIESFYRSHGIDPASLAPIIVVDGFLPEAAMPGLYASADVFALPSRGEGWGLPYLESMACGVPVIATGWSAHLDFVTSENGYLVDHELAPVSKEQTSLSGYYGVDHLWASPSVDHFAELLKRCQRDREETRRKGAKARIDVQDAWSSRRTAEWIADQVRSQASRKTIAVPSVQTAPSTTPSHLRIGFDARTLSVADSVVRGIGNYAWNHLLALLESRPGCDLTVLHDDTIRPPTEIVERAKALGAKWAPWSSRTASDFDIFHTPDPMHVYPGYASPFQRFGSTRVTATFHDIIPIRIYEGRIANWPGYLARLDEIKECGATLLCNSEFTRKDLLAATSIAPDKAIAVMAGFNASSSGRTWTRQEGDTLLRRLGIDKPFFLHVGAADPHKNFESALAACQALGNSRPIQFVVAGKLANALGAMRDQIAQAGLRDVVFTDYLEREELELLYSRAVATLFLSRYEGFGFPALEAMACGCPVIASNAASIPEVVGDAALVHAPDDLPAIATSMLRLLDSPSLREDLARKGRDRASRFDWKDVAGRTWEAWDRIAATESVKPLPPAPTARCQWVSPVWDPSGYGDESRAFVRHLAGTDIGVGVLAWGRHSESFRQAADPADRRRLDSLMGRELSPGRPVVLDMPAAAMGRIADAGFHVGRTTFETDGLPSDWVVRCNSMDEIWVPCRFNKETFSKAGVTKPILVVPEGVDTNRFRPGLAPLDLPGPRKAVTYLAVFEWTHRKAPDLLIQAWATAFTSADDVRLVLRTYPPNQIEGDPAAWVEAKIDEELARLGKRRVDCAPIAVIAKQVPDADMPGLYAAADVYLAPSRGEGWGRPHMEAMSCGLPVVATRWSGNLDFQTDDNSWLIDIDGLEEIDAREEFPFYRGQKWAKPSLADFVRILRISRDDQDLRRAKGERARRDMMQKWDWSKIAPLAETRIREILEGVPAERSSLLARSAIRQDVSPRNPSPSSRSIPGSSAPIRWAGPVFNYSGYARLARETLKGLMDAGVPVSCDPQLSDNAFFASLSGKNAEISRWKSLLATEPVPGPLVICDLPRDANGGDILGALQRDNPGCGKRIAWTMFETDRLPEGWASALNTLDEVWVPSRFNRETFAAAGVMGSKLHVVPGCIDATPYAQAHPMTLPGSGYAFLSVFQWIERKGYDVLLDAWAKAFKPTDPVRLVLRCHPFGDAPPVEEQLEAFLSLRGLRRRDLAPIHVLDSFLPDAEMPSLFAACDCFVLPSRGEGWGLPYLEAMASAKPVIGTAWSAQTEFLTTDNSWLLSPRAPVPVTMTENGKATFLDPSHRWADPDPTELARLLRHAFDHQEEGRAKGLRGSEDARSLWTPARTAAAIAARLSAGSAAPGKDIHRPAPPSPPADASISTKVSSALAKVAEGIRTTSHPATSARKVESIEPTTPSAKLSIRWEGSQFVHHSLAHVNRELCLRLARNGHALSLIPFEPDQFAPGDDPDLSLLARLHNAPLDKACQIHVRHQWPPNLEAPAHGNWVVIQPWEFGSPPKQWISAFADRLDDLWVPSSYCRDLYVDGGMPADRVHVVPNGVDCNRFRPGLAPYALATKKTFKFLYVGGTIARKGFDTLLNAWKEAFGPDDDVCLVVKDMGGGTFYKGQTAKAWIREMQESRKCAEIEYLDGDMEPNQIPSLYAACDVLVHPYRGEGFGLPIAEAMACGLPCVVTRGGAADDFCGETESWGVQAKRVPVPGGKVGPFETVSPPWWLEPSVPDLVEKLRIAKSDHEARRSKGDAARRRIVEGFTWDKAAAIAEERLLEIASRPPRRSASGPRFVSALDKLSLRITNPGGKLAPAASPALPGTGVADGEIDLAELNRLLVRAEAAAARGELGEAEHLTEDAVARFPHQNLAWLARAMVLRGLGKFRKASEAIDRAIKERETPEALLESLQIHLLAGDAAPARKIEKALKERHAAWFKEMREQFRARGQTWPPDLLKPARATNKPAPPARKGKR